MRMLLIAAVLLTCVILAAIRAITSARAQTKAYYAFQRFWLRHWPLHRGRGLPRILRPALKPFVPVWVLVEPQVRMLLDANDLISRVILETGVWDEASWFAIKQHLSCGATFVDIGAHEGYCSLKAARVVGPNGRVIAVEPNPEMVSRLRANIKASGATVISVEPVACSDSETTLDLFVAAQSNTGSSSFSKTNASMYGAAARSCQVNARRIDAIIREAGVSRVDVVKIDAEGAELLVLRGMEETLLLHHPVLLVELDDRLLKSMGTSSSETIAFLRSHGYTLRRSYDEANFEFYPEALIVSSRFRSALVS
jgi:FkbM family methyltransferase